MLGGGEVFNGRPAKPAHRRRCKVALSHLARSIRPQAPQLRAPDKVQPLPKWLFWTLGKFNGQLRELYDVREQHLVPHVFDSSKFEAAFGVTATPYAEGLAACVASLKPKHA